MVSIDAKICYLKNMQKSWSICATAQQKFSKISKSLKCKVKFNSIFLTDYQRYNAKDMYFLNRFNSEVSETSQEIAVFLPKTECNKNDCRFFFETKEIIQLAFSWFYGAELAPFSPYFMKVGIRDHPLLQNHFDLRARPRHLLE